MSTPRLALLLLLLLIATSPSSSYTPSPISIWTTAPLTPSLRLSPQTPLSFSPTTCPSPSTPPTPSLPTLSISPTRLQPLLGFGAAFTETAAYNLYTLKQRNASAYTALLASLFAPPPTGIAISFMRLPITACDLIQPEGPVPWWTFDDTSGDMELTAFNDSAAMRYQIPVLQDVMAVVRAGGGQMRLVGTPWTAPPWIKNTQSWYAGTVLDSWYEWYAAYLVQVVLTFQALGIPLYALCLQNEPNYKWENYPNTQLSPMNETALANLLKPLLRAAGLDTLVIAFDSDPQYVAYPFEVMQLAGGSGQSVDGVAFHCYSGDVGNQNLFHTAYPDTLILFTECSSFGTEVTTADFLKNFLFEQNNVYFSNLNNFGSSGQHWSLAVDLNYGPHSGGCGECSGTVTVDAANASRPYVVKYNAQYYSIGHYSSLIPPMSYRLNSTVLTANGLQSFTAVTPDGSVVIQLFNRNTSIQSVLVQDLTANSCFVATLQPMSLTSYKYATMAGGNDGGGGSDGLSGGAVAGIVIAVLAVVVVLAGIVGWKVKAGRASTQRWQSQDEGGLKGMELTLQ